MSIISEHTNEMTGNLSDTDKLSEETIALAEATNELPGKDILGNNAVAAMTGGVLWKPNLIILVLVLVLAGSAKAATFNQVNLNPDCKIAFFDFAIFNQQWLQTGVGLASDFDGSGTVDIYDLDIFADYWLQGSNTVAPVVQAETFSLLKDTSYTFDIDAASELPLIYTIESLPTKGSVYDSVNTLITSVPYLLPNSTIKYVAGNYNDACDSFTFAANDNSGYNPPCGGKVAATAEVLILSQYPPSANDVNASAVTYIVTSITLVAADDGRPNPPGRLKYIITTLPADVNAYLQDPVSGGMSRLDANHLPYSLSSWGSTVWFATSTVGISDFNFKAYDGNQYSTVKKVTVTVAANPLDCLSFDGNGYVTIPDTNNYFDIEPNKGIGICFATRQPSCTLLKKWAAGKGGYEVGLIGGFISVRIYDNNGTVVAEQKSNYRYDNGQWTNVVVGFNYRAAKLELFIGSGDVLAGNPNWHENIEVFWDDAGVSFPVNIWPAGNDCNLIVGTGYKYEIDAIRAYALDMTDNFRSLAPIEIRSIAGTGDGYVPVSKVRFKCDFADANNTVSSIYDDKSSEHLRGTINDPNHVKYLPFYLHWYDSAAMQQGVR